MPRLKPRGSRGLTGGLSRSAKAGPVPNSWKNPYGLRRRIASTPKWKARGPKNATDPIDESPEPRICSNDRKAHSRHRCARVVAGPWVSRKSPNWALSYDAIEPLRPHIEAAVFNFIDQYRFSPKDFVIANDGQVKTSRPLSKMFLDAVALPQVVMRAAVNWLADLIQRIRDAAQIAPTALPFVPQFAHLVVVPFKGSH